MQQEELIIIILAIALLGICYFSPLKNNVNDKESFKNSDACAGMTRDTYTSNGYNKDGIQLVKSDGVTVGGYRHQIVRPFDSISDQISSDSCNGPCYTGRKYQTWCNEENAMNYHAMRPIISYSEYLKNVQKMFTMIKDPITEEVPNIISPEYTTVFCTETQKSIMDWLMTKMAVAVSKMPEMQRNGPWKSERFYETDVKLFQFVNGDTNIYQVLFNLYNPLRSMSIQVIATVLVREVKGSQMPFLMNIRFVSEPNMTDYQSSANGFGPINGHNISSTNDSYKTMNIIPFNPLGLPDSPEGLKEYGQNWKDDPNQFDWTYQNTLEVQKFNKYGFYSNDKKDNVKIQGGVPDSLKMALSKCSETQLSDCFKSAYTGFTGSISAKSLNDSIGLKKIDGQPENVYAYPNLVYSLNDRKVEKLVY